ncbi:MAG: 16S rRNA (guanine(966)-N(2))-methyltransferase RsmD [Rhodobacteraceae bacterium]|nr:16S rRNA (guanine(966)-N(2))-methyltransferase RsmD [Paracoccaceae bacterium]
MWNMRISAGKFKGLKLHTPKHQKDKKTLRPTSGRIRESMFDILTHGPLGNLIADSSVLDLFAGTGALGMEALSRGAKSATFIEKNKYNLSLLERNLLKAQAIDNSRVLHADATRLPSNKGHSHDLVFLDPPYRENLIEDGILSALNGGWLANECVLVIESGAPVPSSSHWSEQFARRYGTTYITLGVIEHH